MFTKMQDPIANLCQTLSLEADYLLINSNKAFILSKIFQSRSSSMEQGTPRNLCAQILKQKKTDLQN